VYTAIISRVKTRPHPNADRLQLGTIAGEQVIVGLEIPDGMLMVYFPADGQLSTPFAEANDLISRTNRETGAKEGGYFAANCRVRAQRLRGELSEGFACELDKLVVAGVSQKTVDALGEGFEFTTLDDIEICRKFVNPRTRQARVGQQARKLRKKNPMFKEHLDTGQFLRDAGKIPEGALLYLTEKCHGTSGRYAVCKESVLQPNSWWRKLWRRPQKTREEWVRYIGTRRTSYFPGQSEGGYYGTATFREDFMGDVWHLLKKGETVYGEIVGYVSGSTPVMHSPSTAGVQDKKFSKRYGAQMVYSYGCEPGQHRFLVYRITLTNEDGYSVDLSWPQVKIRAAQLGLGCVPDLLAGPFLYSKDRAEELDALVKASVEGESLLDSHHIREGVVVRIEGGLEIGALKLKSFEFKVLEGLAKDSPDNVDMEEAEEAAGDSSGLPQEGSTQ